MITYRDIKIAINSKLNMLGIEINSKDVTEGFNRPSFFVEFLNPIRSGDENQVHKSLSVQIYYFPTDRYEYAIEMLDIQEKLEYLFDMKLPVGDRLLNINETNADPVDGVLNFSFDIEFYEGREYTGEENTIIDELEIDKEIEQGIIVDPEIENAEDYYATHPIEKMEVLEYEKEE